MLLCDGYRHVGFTGNDRKASLAKNTKVLSMEEYLCLKTYSSYGHNINTP